MNGNEAHPVDFMNHDHAFNLLNNGMAALRCGPARPVPRVTLQKSWLDGVQISRHLCSPIAAIMLDKATILQQLREWSTCDVRASITLYKFHVG